MNTKIDFTKPVQTRSGLPVRILCTDLENKDYPVAARANFGGQESVVEYTSDGRWLVGSSDPYDLVNVPEQIEQTVWLNFYNNQPPLLHSSRELADVCAGQNRIACVELKLKVTEGQGL